MSNEHVSFEYEQSCHSKLHIYLVTYAELNPLNSVFYFDYIGCLTEFLILN